MIVAGFGFRIGVTLAALQDALAKAGGPQGVLSRSSEDHNHVRGGLRAAGAALVPARLT